MKLFIPELGTDLKLSIDWTFSLFYERRNWAIQQAFDSISDNALTKWHESECERLNKLVEKYCLENPGEGRYGEIHFIMQDKI